MIAEEAPAALLTALGVDLDPELLVLALTHRSFAHEAGGLPTNERLEFLGDTVLGLVATERLYLDHPELPEGELARMRAATVSQRSLADVARSINLGSFMLLGKGEIATGGDDKDSILSDTLEALFGAVYLGHGFEVAREVVTRLIAPTLDRAADLGAGLDWKTSLQEIAASNGYPVPVYRCTATGPDHARTFTATVSFEGVNYGTGVGSAKKLAEQEAAEAAYRHIKAESVAADGPATLDGPAGHEAL